MDRTTKTDRNLLFEAGYADAQGTQSLNVLDLQREMRTCPKPIIAMVAGFAIGGGVRAAVVVVGGGTAVGDMDFCV